MKRNEQHDNPWDLITLHLLTEYREHFLLSKYHLGRFLKAQ